MSGEVTVRPKAEAAHQKALESKFNTYRSALKPVVAEGLPDGFSAPLTARYQARRSCLQAAVDLAAKGANAATDIGQGDEQSGEKIRSC